MNLFRIVGNIILRLHADNKWRPINYCDTETLIRKIYEYRHDETHRFIKNHEQELKIQRCYKP